jgi:hypothetical protein
MKDAPVPLPHPILRCECNEEAHVKQYRHPSTATRAYYYCRYTIVSTYHCRNTSPYRPSRYETTSSYVSHFVSFTWPRSVYSSSYHTPATKTGQANAQIWALMSSNRWILSSTVTYSYFPHTTCVTYYKQLLHVTKEDEAMSVSYIYNLQHCRSQH